MKKIFMTLAIVLAAHLGLLGQSFSDSCRQQAERLRHTIYRYFYDSASGLFFETTAGRQEEKKHSYLWPLCALLQAANEAERLHPAGDYLSPVMKAIDHYEVNRPPVPGYQASANSEAQDDRFYDDNQWIAIACLDACQRNKKTPYLDKAEEVYRFMMTGYDTAAGGGLYWKEGDHTTKNTCSNGPGVLVALQLYRLTHHKQYLDTALLLYRWVNSHLRSPQGLYYDHLKLPSGKIDSALYTYNTGTMLQAAVLLYHITGHEVYRRQAQQMLEAARTTFYQAGRLPPDYWFNAVLLRGCLELYHLDGNPRDLQFFREEARRIAREETDSRGLVGKGSEGRRRLIDQAAIMEIYARLAAVKDKK